MVSFITLKVCRKKTSMTPWWHDDAITKLISFFYSNLKVQKLQKKHQKCNLWALNIISHFFLDKLGPSSTGGARRKNFRVFWQIPTAARVDS